MLAINAKRERFGGILLSAEVLEVIGSKKQQRNNFRKCHIGLNAIRIGGNAVSH